MLLTADMSEHTDGDDSIEMDTPKKSKKTKEPVALAAKEIKESAKAKLN